MESKKKKLIIAVIIGVILIVGIFFIILNRSTFNRDSQSTTNNNNEAVKSTSQNSKEIDYRNIKIQVGNGKPVGLLATVQEFMEQTGIENLNGYSSFSDTYTFGKGAGKRTRLDLNQNIIGDAQIANISNEEKSYRDCSLLYIGIQEWNENMQIYCFNQKVSNYEELINALGKPYKEGHTLTNNPYAGYRLTYIEDDTNIDVNLRVDFETENKDKIKSIFIGQFYL